MNRKKIHRIYCIISSLVLIAAGICLICACIGIYRSGDHPFSRESVAAAFKPIAYVVYCAIIFVVGGFILDLVLPSQPAREKLPKNNLLILQRLQKKVDLEHADEATLYQLKKIRSARRIHKWVSGIILIISSAIFLCYALNGNNYHPSEINSSMISAMKLLIPCLLPPFAYSIFSAFYSNSSIQKEIALLKQLPVLQDVIKENTTPEGNRLENVLRFAFLTAAVALLIYGFVTGGTADVLTKAINICTECVGLG